MARPMPLAPPVTTATLPASSSPIDRSLARVGRSILARDVAPHERHADGGPATEVGGAGGAGDGVARPVQAGDGAVAHVLHPPAAVNPRAAARPDRAQVDR